MKDASHVPIGRPYERHCGIFGPRGIRRIAIAIAALFAFVVDVPSLLQGMEPDGDGDTTGHAAEERAEASSSSGAHSWVRVASAQRRRSRRRKKRRRKNRRRDRQRDKARDTQKSTPQSDRGSDAAQGGSNAAAAGPNAEQNAGQSAGNGRQRRGQQPKQEDKVFDFTGISLSGQLRTPQLLYFLDRASEELERASLERRSFVPEMVRSIDEYGL